MSRLTIQEVGALLEGMERDAAISPGEKAVVATLIRNHAQEIETYIKQYDESEASADKQRAKQLRRLVEEHRLHPKGLYYSEPLNTLLTNNPGLPVSTTPAGYSARNPVYIFFLKRLATLAVRTLIAGGIILTLYLGYLSMQKGGVIAGEHVSRLEQLIYELDRSR